LRRSLDEVCDALSDRVSCALRKLPPSADDTRGGGGGGLASAGSSSTSSRRRSGPPPGDDEEGARYEIDIDPLRDYLQERVVHQVVFDRYGEVAARILSALRHRQGEEGSSGGWMESDALAERAMVPAKDARVALHRLYRGNYVDLMPVGASGRHVNPAHTVYLWGIASKPRLRRQVTENVASALWNIRLRREHHLSEQGGAWVDRAQSLSTQSPSVALERDRYWLGLERLDHAILQLDDTLLIMHDL
jgi:DNA-directed RNA polymerase III subunit RPC3